MKRHIYVLALMVSFMSLVACSKNDPAPASPVVGRWDLDRAVLSGFTSTTANINGPIDLYAYFNYGSRIDIYSDNTFNQNVRDQGDILGDAGGTWDFTNNTLTLRYDVGGQNSYTYSKNKNIEELAETAPQSFTAGSAVGRIQLVFRK